MTVHATPDRVLAIYGGLAGGLVIGAAWWLTWRLSGDRLNRRVVAVTLRTPPEGKR